MTELLNKSFSTIGQRPWNSDHSGGPERLCRKLFILTLFPVARLLMPSGRLCSRPPAEMNLYNTVILMLMTELLNKSFLQSARGLGIVITREDPSDCVEKTRVK